MKPLEAAKFLFGIDAPKTRPAELSSFGARLKFLINGAPAHRGLGHISDPKARNVIGISKRNIMEAKSLPPRKPLEKKTGLANVIDKAVGHVKGVDVAKQRVIAMHTKADPVLVKNDLGLADLPKLTDPKYGTVSPLEQQKRDQYRQQFDQFVTHFKDTLRNAPNGKLTALEEQTLADELKLLFSDPEVPALAFTLSDGKAFMQEIADQIMSKAEDNSIKYLLSFHLPNRIDDGTLARIYDKAVEGLTGSMDMSDRSLMLGEQRYERAERLGGGNFGEVYRYVKSPPVPNDTGVVLKQIKLSAIPSDPAKKRALLREAQANEIRLQINASGSGGNSHMGPILYVILSPNNEVHAVLPVAKFGSLDSALQTINHAHAHSLVDLETTAKMKLTPLLDVAEDIEKLQLAKKQEHGDIATRNILINGQAFSQAADFGLGEELTGDDPATATSKATGTEPMPTRWAAPERLLVGLGAPVTSKADTWSFGMTLYEVVFGERPFKTLSNEQVIEKYLQFDPTDRTLIPKVDEAKWPPPMAEKLQALFVDLLQVDPAKRISMDEVQKRLRNDFPGVGTPEIRDWMKITLSNAEPDLKTTSLELAKLASASPATWTTGLADSLKKLIDSNAPGINNPIMGAKLSEPDALYDALVKSAVDAAAPADKEKTRAAMRSPEFQKAFRAEYETLANRGFGEAAKILTLASSVLYDPLKPSYVPANKDITDAWVHEFEKTIKDLRKSNAPELKHSLPQHILSDPKLLFERLRDLAIAATPDNQKAELIRKLQLPEMRKAFYAAHAKALANP